MATTFKNGIKATVPAGAKIGTAAPEGFPNPVGGNFP
jgi:hypothetical protein